ncbi:DegT/DnrJ/EryC1/StrS aminotransferase family protein [Fusibacter paucivorans]|uniref:DegT/DnrJ/EryC1/StrS aminotransferase family protein n=1 Tax=Fusibacter paucivorans TaxID=76009 RepID=A0ABS5PVE8_9FIRM|nr:DegT/DnrJ/EryC1/StrS family aminotransferase [Fusibacter paucivorans]MBS7528107.1 DegT/DnrJ/EryC1/StrS aminotransferase family protein [Fusibacter paucivorans]
MIINKSASEKGNYRLYDYYYDSAREGMYDLLLNMTNDGLIKTVFVPGYVGWSPREGSGIFDPINKIDNVSVVYYLMNNNLNIDLNSLYEKIDRLDNDKFAVLIVNYFGFIDPNIEEIYSRIKEKNGWIIEDNAHGFFTSLYSKHSSADATFFSLHKMFPFSKGGSIKVINDNLKKYSFEGKNVNEIDHNPWMYDISKIACIRKSNYEKIDKLVRSDKYISLFEPLKDKLDDGIIPQTYPIRIQVGNRDKIYEMMNQSGYGVVSLYHTLIEPLRNSEHSDALSLSKHILNLPVHQDVNSNEYENMVELLAKYCIETV